MLTIEQIQHRAPSVFATQPWEKTSDKYQFFPTDYVVRGLLNNGFRCVMAGQAKTRIEGKGDFTRHILRFRHDDMPRLGHDALPEVVMVNSHDGSSSYRLMLGVFRLVCANGMIACSSMMEEVRVRHTGKDTLVDDVIEGSYRIIDEAPKAIGQIQEWQGIKLLPEEQENFASAALTLRGSTLEVEPKTVLRARRYDDDTDADGSRDLWKTMNVVQESMIRGGGYGLSPATGRLRRMNAVKSVVEDVRLNRALWQLTEGQAKLKTKATA